MDALSFAIALIFVSLFASCALALFAWQRRHVPGLTQLAIGSFTITLGIILLVLREVEISRFLSTYVANLLLPGGRLIQLYGMAKFWDERHSRAPAFAAACLAIVALTLPYYVFVLDIENTRIGLLSVMTVILSVAFVDVIGSGLKRRSINRPLSALVRNTGAYAFIGTSIFVAFTEIALAYFRFGADFVSEQALLPLLILYAMALTLFTTFSILFMNFEEQRIERSETQSQDPLTGELNPDAFESVGMQLYRSACLSKNTVLLIGIELLGLTGVVSREGPERSNQIVIDTVAKIREHFGDDALLCRYRFDRLFLVTTQIESREAQKKISRLEDELPSALALASPSAIIGFKLASMTKQPSEPVARGDFEALLYELEIELIRRRLG
jgi:GGDEF domain-containing protein